MAADQSPNYVSAVHATKLPPAEAERVFNKLCNELVRTHVTESSSPKSGLNHIPLETHISTARDKLTPTFGADDTNGNERQEIEHREMPEDGHVSRGLLDANSPELLNGTLYDFTSSKSPIQPLVRIYDVPSYKCISDATFRALCNSTYCSGFQKQQPGSLMPVKLLFF